MTRAEVRWAVTWAAVVMLITCLPYLYVARLAPPGTSFSGLLCSADDHCVYLAWEQQAAQGHFYLRNLFTGDAQRGLYVHLLAWLIGSLARLTGIPLLLMHHAARVALGMLTLVLAYRFFALFTTDLATRRAAFWFTAFSAGLGWLFPLPAKVETAVVDLWQPEAITFLCLYVNGLFCAALSLMIGLFVLLLTAEEKTGWQRWSRVVGAGLLGLLLGNIHSYDIFTVAGVWGAYLVVRAVASRRVPLRALADASVAALVALPATAYQYYLYQTEPVFRMRADTKTLAAPLTSYLLGYGLVLILAIGGAIWMVRCALRAVRSAECEAGGGGTELSGRALRTSHFARERSEPLGQRLFLLTWAVVGFALPYLPFAFQRRLLLGLHLPLAFLAAVGAIALARCLAALGRQKAKGKGQKAKGRGRFATSLEKPAGHLPFAFCPLPFAFCLSFFRRSERSEALIVTGLLLLTMPSIGCFIHRDVADATSEAQGHVDPLNVAVFWPRADLEAIAWARRNLAKDGLIFCSTGSGILFPALAGRPVYVGHWSETPRANEKMQETLLFYRSTGVASQARRAFLEERGIRYVYLGTSERCLGGADLARDPLFRPIYSKDGATIYEVRGDLAAASASSTLSKVRRPAGSGAGS